MRLMHTNHRTFSNMLCKNNIDVLEIFYSFNLFSFYQKRDILL